MRIRYILDAEDEEMVLALRAARSALKHPSFTDGIIAFGDSTEAPTIDFYVKKNKASVSARQVSRQ